MPAVAIVGGGPAGLMAAEILSRESLRVTIYDRMPSVGRKLLMAGRGGLNLTHGEPLPRFLERYGPAQSDLTAAVAAFPPEQLRQWADGLGAATFVGSSGRVFPAALKASPLLRAWLRRLDTQGVTFVTRQRWTGWDSDGALRLRPPDSAADQHPVRVLADATLFALGGASWPRLGSDGGWVAPFEAAGITVAPLLPANCGFCVDWSPSFRNRFAGQPLKNLALTSGDRRIRGELVITDYGLEGGALYALSADLRKRVKADSGATISLDLRPELSVERLTGQLQRVRARESLANHLRKIGLSPAAAGLVREAAGRAAPRDPAALGRLIKEVPLALTAPQPLARAISTAGGVAFTELDERFMLRRRPGTFVAGEMLDWEAPTGGYLLQASFATGVAAAHGILAWLAARRASSSDPALNGGSQSRRPAL